MAISIHCMAMVLLWLASHTLLRIKYGTRKNRSPSLDLIHTFHAMSQNQKMAPWYCAVWMHWVQNKIIVYWETIYVVYDLCSCCSTGQVSLEICGSNIWENTEEHCHPNSSSWAWQICCTWLGTVCRCCFWVSGERIIPNLYKSLCVISGSYI